MPRHSPYALISLTLELCSIIKFLLIVVFPTIIFIVVFLICITFNIASLFNFQAAAWKLSFPMGTSGLEPPTSRLSGVRSNHLSYAPKRVKFFACSFSSSFVSSSHGGDEEDRTPDPLLAKQVLSQLSYTPV